MKTCVITGGNGYIGSHMCKKMVEEGYDVHIIDNHSTSPEKPVHEYGTFHNLDIADEARIKPLLKKLNPEYLFHFAARAIVPESESDPMLYYRENLIKTLSLLNSCIDSGVENFIFSSTCATFGAHDDKISETHNQNPTNTYGRTKLMMETVMRDLTDKKLINVLVFRYFNAAGSDPKCTIGENHIPETHLIPNLCLAHLEGDNGVFNIYGDDFPTPDGTCVRDYIHVDDLAIAHFKGAKELQKSKGFLDFNLGSGNGYSVKEVLTAFEKVANTKLKSVVKERRAGDPPSLTADSSKAQQTLNFKLQYSLEDCIKHTLDYFQLRSKRTTPTGR